MQTLSTLGAWAFAPLLLLVSTLFFNKRYSIFQGAISIMALLWASLFAAASFQVGGDWDGYELYYEAIDTNVGLIGAYLINPRLLQFEPGYYLVAYVTKYFGAPYTLVNAISIASLLLVFAVLIKRISAPPYIIIFVFLGLPFLTLFYNQVRQCFAIAFVLLAVQAKTNRSFFIFAILALFFQVSTVIFVAIALIIRCSENFGVKVFRAALISMPFLALLTIFRLIDSYSLLQFILPESLTFKIDIYAEEETSVGILRLVAVGYLLFVANSLFRETKRNKALTSLEITIIGNAIVSTLLIPYALLLFANSYAFFGRALTYSLILLSISGAILHKIKSKTPGVKIDIRPFYGLGVLSFFYYFVSLYNYSGVYFPYKSIFSY